MDLMNFLHFLLNAQLKKRLDLWNVSMKNLLEGMKWMSCFYGLEYWVNSLNIHHLLDFFQCFLSKHPHVMAWISRMPSIGKISSQVSSPMVSSTWYNTHFLWQLKAWVLMMFVKAFLVFLNWCNGCVPIQLIHKSFFWFSSALVDSFGARGKACGAFVK